MKAENGRPTTGGITLLLGGTGKTGRRIAERLTDRGVPIRVASRSGEPPFDWGDRNTWAPMLEGVSAVYLNYAPDLAIPGAADAIREFTRLAVEHGVERIVVLSGRGEEEAQRCEHIVEESGVDWTILRASWFNQNFSEGAFLEAVRAGEVALPAGGVREPFVDADDIADVAVAALTEDGHQGQLYELTGPRMLTFAEAVDEIARASGREVRFTEISRGAFADAVKGYGLPDGVAWLLDYLFGTVLDGRNEYLTDGVQRALKREPRDFAAYAHATAAADIWGG